MKTKLTLLFICIFVICTLVNAQQSQIINMQSGTHVITTCLAEFYDSGGKDLNYQNNERDTLTIFPPSNLTNAKICVTFHKFSTEVGLDYLNVYDGDSVLPAQLINGLSGPANRGTIRSTDPDGSLTFLFNSNNTTPGNGWWATISIDTMPQEITTIADGVWTVSHGTFMDNGGINADYTNSAQVTVTLLPLIPGDKVSVSFNECILAAGDILYVFNGIDVMATQIAALRGTNFGTITSTDASGALTFQFQSNATGTNEGWNATIGMNLQPDDITTISDGTYIVSQARFFDNGGPGVNYGDSKNATVVMMPQNPSDKVSVTFHECNIALSDFLYVYDGVGTSAPLLAVINGEVYGSVRSSAANGALTFQFVSDATSNAAGWNASVTSWDPAWEDVSMLSKSTFKVGCNGRFFDSGGPNKNYGNGLNQITTIFPENSNDKISVTFHSFITQVNNDILYVYDGMDTTAALLGSYSGNLAKFTVSATSSNGALTFKFISSTTTPAAGWSASINCSSTLQSYNLMVNGTMTINEDEGFIYDSGGPGSNYGINENNVATFTPVTPGSPMSLTFISFSTYAADDYLDVFDGTTIFSAKIARLYLNGGYGTISASISAANPTGSLTINFVSNASGNNSGFAAHYTINATPQIISMPGNFIMDSGFYYDSGGPNDGDYVQNIVDNITTISPSTPGTKISLNFSSFSTYYSDDYIEVFDGMNITDPKIAELSEKSGYGTITATNSTGSLTMRFVSNASGNSSGWAAIISNNANPKTISLPGTYVVDKGFFTDAGGAYFDYTDDMSNFTTIKPSSASQKIRVSFNDFEMYNSSDYLDVYDGTSDTDPLIAHLTEKGGYGTIMASANNSSGALSFKFSSIGSGNHSGWNAAISSVDDPNIISLPGTFETNSGFFYDAGGPENNYLDNMNTVTTIKPVGGIGKISVSFNYLKFYNTSDTLLVYDGNSITSQLIGTITDTLSQGTFTSSAPDGSLTFKFISTSSGNSEGWAASISVNPNCWSGGVGIPESQLDENSIVVFPNPSTGDFNLNFDNWNDERVQYSIMNTMGKIISHGTIEDASTKISLNQPSGLYILSIGNSSYQIIKKLLIQNR